MPAKQRSFNYQNHIKIGTTVPQTHRELLSEWSNPQSEPLDRYLDTILDTIDTEYVNILAKHRHQVIDGSYDEINAYYQWHPIYRDAYYVIPQERFETMTDLEKKTLTMTHLPQHFGSNIQTMRMLMFLCQIVNNQCHLEVMLINNCLSERPYVVVLKGLDNRTCECRYQKLFCLEQTKNLISAPYLSTLMQTIVRDFLINQAPMEMDDSETIMLQGFLTGINSEYSQTEIGEKIINRNKIQPKQHYLPNYLLTDGMIDATDALNLINRLYAVIYQLQQQTNDPRFIVKLNDDYNNPNFELIIPDGVDVRNMAVFLNTIIKALINAPEPFERPDLRLDYQIDGDDFKVLIYIAGMKLLIRNTITFNILTGLCSEEKTYTDRYTKNLQREGVATIKPGALCEHVAAKNNIEVILQFLHEDLANNKTLDIATLTASFIEQDNDYIINVDDATSQTTI